MSTDFEASIYIYGYSYPLSNFGLVFHSHSESITYLWSANLFKSFTFRSVAYVNQSLDSLAISSDLMSHIAHKMQLNSNEVFLGQFRCPFVCLPFVHINASTSFAYLFFHLCKFLIEIEISSTHIYNKMSVFFHYDGCQLLSTMSVRARAFGHF